MQNEGNQGRSAHLVDVLNLNHISSRASDNVRRFPKYCACEQEKGRPGMCYYFLKDKGYKCKSRKCFPRYTCVPKEFLAKNGKGKKVTVCIKRVSKRKIVPWVRKGAKKGYCKKILTKKMIFYVPYVRALPSEEIKE